jgi:hypothetical protein
MKSGIWELTSDPALSVRLHRRRPKRIWLSIALTLKSARAERASCYGA